MPGWARKLKFWAQEPEPSPDRRSGRDRRVHERVEIPYWGHVTLEFLGLKSPGYVKNVSRGGLFVETEHIHDKNTKLRFQFFLPHSKQPISGTAQVTWSRPEWGSALEPPGVGLQFVEFDAASQVVFEEFVSAYMTKARPRAV